MQFHLPPGKSLVRFTGTGSTGTTNDVSRSLLRSIAIPYPVRELPMRTGSGDFGVVPIQGLDGNHVGGAEAGVDINAPRR